MQTNSRNARAFTFVELLVTMALVAILASIAYPVFITIMERARKTQAKNDLTQIVTAVNAFYTEYGKYPTSFTTDATAIYGPAGPNTNDLLFNELRACHLENGVLTDPSCSAAGVLNTRQIVYISPPAVKDPNQPRSGIGIPSTSPSAPTPVGQFWDPWGRQYNVTIDADYNNSTTNPYGPSGGAGVDPVQQGVIAWSFGKNGALGGGPPAAGFRSEGGTANNFSGSGDVISWQ
jgi:prepilin-type N-terminal cleavage/methylation domain-containing protein